MFGAIQYIDWTHMFRPEENILAHKYIVLLTFTAIKIELPVKKPCVSASVKSTTVTVVHPVYSTL